MKREGNYFKVTSKIQLKSTMAKLANMDGRWNVAINSYHVVKNMENGLLQRKASLKNTPTKNHHSYRANHLGSNVLSPYL